MVIGDKRNFLSLLICLKTNSSEHNHTDELASEAAQISRKIQSSAKTISEAITDRKWTDFIEDKIAAANALAFSRAHHIRKWRLLPTEFSQQGGELTPTMKVKRNIVCDKYAELIDSMYVTIDDEERKRRMTDEQM